MALALRLCTAAAARDWRSMRGALASIRQLSLQYSNPSSVSASMAETLTENGGAVNTVPPFPGGSALGQAIRACIAAAVGRVESAETQSAKLNQLREQRSKMMNMGRFATEIVLDTYEFEFAAAVDADPALRDTLLGGVACSHEFICDTEGKVAMQEIFIWAVQVVRGNTSQEFILGDEWTQQFVNAMFAESATQAGVVGLLDAALQEWLALHTQRDSIGVNDQPCDAIVKLTAEFVSLLSLPQLTIERTEQRMLHDTICTIISRFDSACRLDEQVQMIQMLKNFEVAFLKCCSQLSHNGIEEYLRAASRLLMPVSQALLNSCSRDLLTKFWMPMWGTPIDFTDDSSHCSMLWIASKMLSIVHIFARQDTEASEYFAKLLFRQPAFHALAADVCYSENAILPTMWCWTFWFACSGLWSRASLIRDVGSEHAVSALKWVHELLPEVAPRINTDIALFSAMEFIRDIAASFDGLTDLADGALIVLRLVFDSVSSTRLLKLVIERWVETSTCLIWDFCALASNNVVSMELLVGIGTREERDCTLPRHFAIRWGTTILKASSELERPLLAQLSSMCCYPLIICEHGEICGSVSCASVACAAVISIMTWPDHAQSPLGWMLVMCIIDIAKSLAHQILKRWRNEASVISQLFTNAESEQLNIFRRLGVVWNELPETSDGFSQLFDDFFNELFTSVQQDLGTRAELRIMVPCLVMLIFPASCFSADIRSSRLFSAWSAGKQLIEEDLLSSESLIMLQLCSQSLCCTGEWAYDPERGFMHELSEPFVDILRLVCDFPDYASMPAESIVSDLLRSNISLSPSEYENWTALFTALRHARISPRILCAFADFAFRSDHISPGSGFLHLSELFSLAIGSCVKTLGCHTTPVTFALHEHFAWLLCAARCLILIRFLDDEERVQTLITEQEKRHAMPQLSKALRLVVSGTFSGSSVESTIRPKFAYSVVSTPTEIAKLARDLCISQESLARAVALSQPKNTTPLFASCATFDFQSFLFGMIDRFA